MEYFNEEQAYDAEIAPLMAQIIAKCKQHKIPMMASFTFEHCEQNGVGTCDTLIDVGEARANHKYKKAMHEIRRPDNPSFAVAITQNLEGS